MRKLTFIVSLTLVFACREAPEAKNDLPVRPKNTTTIYNDNHTDALKKVLEAHGGLGLWKEQRTLSYEIPKGDAIETQTTDLKSRKDRIEGAGYSLGFDGEQVWLSETGGTFEGDPVFYHNLIFYFYAMPFVLADDGIRYGTVQDLEYQGKSYPGIRISYESGTGTSPKDEYYLYYDPETFLMEWLGYTVTYFSDARSEDVKWIRYSDWMKVNGLLLPESLTWYKYEGRTISDPRNTLTFGNVSISFEPRPEGFYSRPAGAQTVTAQK